MPGSDSSSHSDGYSKPSDQNSCNALGVSFRPCLLRRALSIGTLILRKTKRLLKQRLRNQLLLLWESPVGAEKVGTVGQSAIALVRLG